MPPIENRILNESRTRDEDHRDSFRDSQNISEERRHVILITVYTVGAFVFFTFALYLCRRARNFFTRITCNAGAARRERAVEEGPKTPQRSRRPSDEGKEELHHRRFLKKTLLRLELEQYHEVHYEWLQRLEEREKRAHEHRRDLNKKERHLLRVIRKLKGRPRVTLEDRHREQRLEDLENILEKRHHRLEVLQKEVNESMGTYLRIRAQHSEESSPQTRVHSRTESRASIDYEKIAAAASSHDQKKLREVKKLSGHPSPRITSENTPHTDQSQRESSFRNTILKTPTVPEIDQTRQDMRRVSLLETPKVPSVQHVERKSIVIDPGAVLKSSLKSPHKPTKSLTAGEADEALDIKPYTEQEKNDDKNAESETKTISDRDSKLSAPRGKREDGSKPESERKSEPKPPDFLKKSVDQSKPDPGRKSESEPRDSKKSTDDMKPKPHTSSKTRTENKKDSDTKDGEPLKQDTRRKSETKPPENVRKSTTRPSESSRTSEAEGKSKPSKSSQPPDEDKPDSNKKE